LVVDDDPDIRRMLQELLEAENYRVLSARNGGEALRYVATHPTPLLMLLDLMMPEVDGYTVLRELRADAALRTRCRVVVMSASEHLDAGGLDGADGALAKPFDLMDLLDTVDVLARDDAPNLGGTVETSARLPDRGSSATCWL
jgi:CheY-like chemotaxis protein